MKFTSFVLTAILFAAFTVPASADTVLPRSKDFAANYQTLVNDRKASPAVADCIASAYDYVKKNARYDRLGFTGDEIAAASTDKSKAKFSAMDQRQVSVIISMQGAARNRSAGYKWDGIVLRCGLMNGKLKAIEFVLP
ncbi:MAG: hypothetical protein QM744_16280 [Mesorhizobium sp.]